MKHFLFVIFALVCLFSADDSPLCGQSTARGNWRQKVSCQNDAMPLARFLKDRGEFFHFAWFIDRRLDPELPVEGSFEQIPLAEVFAKIAQANQLSFYLFNSAVYFGPPEGAGELLLANTLFREKIRSDKNRSLTSLLKEIPLRGEQFVQPRSLLDTMTQSTGMKWTGLDRMPLDCWNAFALPPIPIYEQAGLILNSFGVRFDIGEQPNTLRPIAMETQLPIVREYPLSRLSTERRNSVEHCEFEEISDSDGRKVRVTGPFKQVAKLEYLVWLDRIQSGFESQENTSDKRSGSTRSNQRVKNSTPADHKSENKEVSGKIENKRIADVFSYLESTLDLKFRLDDSCHNHGITPDSRITCEFNRTDVNQLIAILAKAIGVKGQRRGNEVIFTPQEK